MAKGHDEQLCIPTAKMLRQSFCVALLNLAAWRETKSDFAQTSFFSIFAAYTVVVAQLVRASDCGSEGRGFEPHHPPSFKAWYLYRAFFIHTGHFPLL